MAEHHLGGGTVTVGRGADSGRVVVGDPDVVALVSQPATERRARRMAGDLESEGRRTVVRVLPDGEDAKTLGVVAELYEWLAESGVGRDDVLVAVGGGALTDAAGFAAATYLRGIAAVYVPTTLLGAVDAAVGGKTGLNLLAKNQIGLFRHPRRVVVDVDVLDGLPEHLKRDGAAEALKAGLVGDPGLVDLLGEEGLDADLEEVVDRAVAVKVRIVEGDFRDEGQRLHLNYGHTVGHAVEVAAGTSHGAAVAVGMVAAGRASALEAGFAEEDRQRDAIRRLGLPVAAPGTDRGRVLELLALDKKRDAGGLRMALLAGVGRPLVSNVPSATVEAALTAVEI